MRTKCGLNDPSAGPSFEGPFPPGNGPSATADATAGTARPVPLTDHPQTRQRARLAGRDWSNFGAKIEQVFALQDDPRPIRRPGRSALTGPGRGASSGLLRGDDIVALVVAVAPGDIPEWITPDVEVLEMPTTSLTALSPHSAPVHGEGSRSASPL